MYNNQTQSLFAEGGKAEDKFKPHIQGQINSDKYGTGGGGRAGFSKSIGKDADISVYIEGGGFKPTGGEFKGKVTGGGVTYNKRFAEGGMADEGGTVDPVSGNEVPPGAMQNEVRDDISAKLSEGEFVFPADVVRYVGLERLMQIRDLAKEGLRKMDEIGQMGNADQVEDPEALHGEEFSKSIDSIMAGMPKEEEPSETEMAMGGMATDQTQFQAPPPAGTMNDQQFMNNLAPYFTPTKEPAMAKGGLMAKKKM